MRIKRLFKALALVLVISAFALPTTAFAAGGKDTAPPSLDASLTDGKVKIEATDDNSGVEAVYIDGNRVNSLTDGKAAVILKDYAGNEKSVSVYAVDYAGNRSETVKFDNPYYKEPKPEPQAAAPVKPAQSQSAGTSAQQKPSGSSGGASNTAAGNSSPSSDENAGGANEENTSAIPEGAFTPDGSASVLDEAEETADDKQFYTITTEAGNVFYLIIDGKRDSQNVYFLNGVTEADLMALAEKGDGSMSVIPAGDTCICTEKCEAGKVKTDCPVCKNDLTGCTGKEVAPSELEQAEPEQQKKDTGSVGTIIFVVIALLAVGGIGYYVKIVRPKQQAADEDEDFDDDGYGEGFDPDAAYGEPEYLSEDDFDDKENNAADQDGQ